MTLSLPPDTFGPNNFFDRCKGGEVFEMHLGLSIGVTLQLLMSKLLSALLESYMYRAEHRQS